MERTMPPKKEIPSLVRIGAKAFRRKQSQGHPIFRVTLEALLRLDTEFQREHRGTMASSTDPFAKLDSAVGVFLGEVYAGSSPVVCLLIMVTLSGC
jgi:hypothetical protein